MKHLLIFSAVLILSASVQAQKGKSKNEQAKKEAREVILGSDKSSGSTGTSNGNTGTPSGNQNAKKSGDEIPEGASNKGGGKFSKNQPAKVRSAFQSDYPNATNVSWSKDRGDWTATFNNGLVTSTAVYHANGQRKDTRTVVGRPQLPKVIIDDIFKKRPRTQLGEIVKIETPTAEKEIYRIKTTEAGTSRYVFYTNTGSIVKYNY
jgi:hypothetical protein